MTAGQMEIAEGGTVGGQLVGDYQPGCEALLPDLLAHEPQGGALIASALNQYVEDLALVIDGTPQIHPLADYANDHLIQVPPEARTGPPLPQPSRDDRSEL